MAVLNGKEITDDDLFALFPEQSFPDLEGLSLCIDAKALHISCEDSEWALQADIALAVGPGCMSFFYTGELNFQMAGHGSNQAISIKGTIQAGLTPPEDLRLIKRGKPWEFMFSMAAQKTMTIYAEITGLSWQPAEE